VAGTSERSTQNIVEVLVAQHHQVDELFSRVLGANDDGRARMFAQLLHVLALHESAEHVVVHPEARKIIDGDEALITALMSEEVAIRDALVESEHVSVEAHDFPGRLARIRDMVVKHNRREESDEFPLLNQRLDASERTRLTWAVEELGKLAASGTEAEFEHAELAAGSPNMMVGPFAAILDRARRLIAESSEDRP
jgi:hemerythrin superfamily protein